MVEWLNQISENKSVLAALLGLVVFVVFVASVFFFAKILQRYEDLKETPLPENRVFSTTIVIHDKNVSTVGKPGIVAWTGVITINGFDHRFGVVWRAGRFDYIIDKSQWSDQFRPKLTAADYATAYDSLKVWAGAALAKTQLPESRKEDKS